MATVYVDYSKHHPFVVAACDTNADRFTTEGPSLSKNGKKPHDKFIFKEQHG
jgi:hypothetical protein